MRNLLMVVAIMFIVVLIGCAEKSSFRTAPWTEIEIEEMENSEVTSVPICHWKF